MPMEMFMRETGKMTKLMEKAFTPTLMGQGMRGSGKKTSSMATELKDGQTAHVIKGST